VAETVQNFITAMDSLKLHMVAVDQLQPLLHDLMDSLNKVSSLPPEWEGKTKLKNWCELLLAAELKDFASLTFSG
jgi:ESCRT-I complex subunit VPS28